MKTEAPKELGFRRNDDGRFAYPLSYFKSAPASWGIKDAYNTLIATVSLERDAEELVKAWNQAYEMANPMTPEQNELKAL